MKRNKVSIITYIMLMLLLFASVIPAHAYNTIGYKLTGAWYNDHYYIPVDSITVDGKTVNYESIARAAVSQWNRSVNASAGHSLNINLTQGSDGSSTSTRFVFSPLDRGPTGYRGLAVFYTYDWWNGWVQIEEGSGPNKNYTAGSAIINIYYVHSLPTWAIQNTMMHEMGHIMGLLHTDVKGSLMVNGTYVYNNLVPPQSDDIAGVRSIYE